MSDFDALYNWLKDNEYYTGLIKLLEMLIENNCE